VVKIRPLELVEDELSFPDCAIPIDLALRSLAAENVAIQETEFYAIELIRDNQGRTESDPYFRDEFANLKDA